ncbi:MAG: helix-turn-helix domain-containing protein [Firmicutes bacterium]|nr:helix-turn-helix domain-containing protein [Bacillota bacterium]
MKAFKQKEILEPGFPFKLFLNEAAFSFPPHWHEEIEIIYVESGNCKVGLNNIQYDLKTGDVLLIGSGDVHYFLPRLGDSKKVFIQFGLSIFNDLSTARNEGRFITPLLSKTHQLSKKEQPVSNENELIHQKLEKQILKIIEEFNKKQDGYHLVLKARLYDIVAILLRNIPQKEYTLNDKNKQNEQLERLKNVFEYVEKYYTDDITLNKVADVANYSVYYFARFFKEATGMTFGQYLEHYRIGKAEWLLINERDKSITDISFDTGFNSIKTFYRVFKKIKGCSPKEFQKSAFK